MEDEDDDDEEEEEEEEEEEFFNHYKNDLERHAHTPSGVAGAQVFSQQFVVPERRLVRDPPR